jgi:peroxiredoxin
VCAETVEQIAEFKGRLRLPYTLMSDRDLLCADKLGVPLTGLRGYTGSLALHPIGVPMFKHRKFLQPSVFIWRKDGTRAHSWKQAETMKNLYGARGRPTGEEIVELARRVVSE